jgi:hypothetical protein
MRRERSDSACKCELISSPISCDGIVGFTTATATGELFHTLDGYRPNDDMNSILSEAYAVSLTALQLYSVVACLPVSTFARAVSRICCRRGRRAALHSVVPRHCRCPAPHKHAPDPAGYSSRLNGSGRMQPCRRCLWGTTCPKCYSLYQVHCG